MTVRTLDQLRTSVKLRYGDSAGVTTSNAEIDEYLESGLNKILLECPWFNITEYIINDSDITAGKINFTGDVSVEQLHYVKIATSVGGPYRILKPVPAASINETDSINTSVENITGYFVVGSWLYFYPYTEIDSGIWIKYLAQFNVVTNFTFPTVGSDILHAYFPDTFDDAVVRWALYELFTKDADGEMADRAKREFDNIVRALTISFNKPQVGEVITPRQTDFYLLDQGSWFDA